jgi:hypothetical protein
MWIRAAAILTRRGTHHTKSSPAAVYRISMGEPAEGYGGVWRGAPHTDRHVRWQTNLGEVELRIGNRAVVNGSVDGEL